MQDQRSAKITLDKDFQKKREEEDAQHRCQQILEMIETDDLAGLKMWSVTIEEM